MSEKKLKKITAERLKEARKMMGTRYTQVVVCSDLNIHEKTLGGYETGNSSPDYETLVVLANYYGVSTDWLLGNTNNPKNTLTSEEREAVHAVNMDDESFLELSFKINGRELSRDEKIKLKSLAAHLLDKDR